MDEDPKTSFIHINYLYQESDLKLNLDAIKSAAWHICQLLCVDQYELSIIFSDDTYIQKLNHQYRNKNTPTDVLSFPQEEWDRPLSIESNLQSNQTIDAKTLGDIVISIDSAKKNAHNIGQSIHQEIYFLLIHGILHLCGHDHIEKEEETNMIHQQKEIISKLKLLVQTPQFICSEGAS